MVFNNKLCFAKTYSAYLSFILTVKCYSFKLLSQKSILCFLIQDQILLQAFEALDHESRALCVVIYFCSLNLFL